MAKRKKRLIKQKESLLKQVQKHMRKLEIEAGRKDTTREYWEKEIKGFKQRAQERDEILKKILRKKK